MRKKINLCSVITAILICLISPSFAAMNWVQATGSAGWAGRAEVGHSAVVFDNKIWIMGGGSWSHTLFYNDVWYSEDGATWAQATDSAGWNKRFLTSVVFNNKIWVLGGTNSVGTVFYNDVWYSTDGINWAKGTNSAGWSKRYGHTAVVFNGKMWVFGGTNLGVYCDDVWYSEDGISWAQATDSAGWPARAGHSSVVFDNKIWVMGGAGKTTTYNDVWYSEDGINWIQAAASAGWAKRDCHASVVFDNKIWVMGGEEIYIDDFYNDAWYSEDGETWAQATDSAGWAERAGYNSVIFDGKIWVIGGVNSSSGKSWIYYNDAWYSTGLRIEENSGLKIKDARLKIVKNKILLSLPVTIYDLRLTIFDLCGREREVVYEGTLGKGTYTFSPKAKNSGIYFVKLSFGGYRVTRKMVLTR